MRRYGAADRSACRVSVSADEIATFARTWPGSGLRYRSVWFAFDPRGNVVDTNDRRAQPRANEHAIVALCDDARAYAETICPFQ